MKRARIKVKHVRPGDIALHHIALQSHAKSTLLAVFHDQDEIGLIKTGKLVE